jgi:hypothetical protein
MRLSHLKVKNYRSFLEADLALRPLTLIYGENSSGKSALLRLLPVLGGSVGRLDGAPLPSDVQALRGGGPVNMLSSLRDRADDPRMSFRLTHGAYTASWRFRDADTYGLVTVQRLTLEGPDTSLELELREDLEPRGESLPYSAPDEERARWIAWRGLLPVAEDDDMFPAAWLAALGALGGAVQWIDSTRKRVARRYTTPQQHLRQLAPNGADAALALWRNSAAREEVSRWYLDHFGRRIELNALPQLPNEFTLDTTTEEIGAPPVALADGGEGLGQLLPIITALAMARQADSGLRILALEEPESHLHVGRHEALLNELVRTATSAAAPTVVVETHSRELLLSTMLSIAEGRISAEDVVVHYVYKDIAPFAAARAVPGLSRLLTETFDPRGRPRGANLPPDIFTSDLALASRLQTAQMRR